MAKRQTAVDNQRVLLSWLVGIGIVVLLGGLFLWYNYVHRSSYNVFWDTIDNNLNITGVTRSIKQETSSGTVDQKLQISLGAENVARGMTTITQANDTGGTTKVVTETLGTPTSNYARYVDITVNAPNEVGPATPDIAAIKNVWGREMLVTGEQQNQSVFAEGLFSSIPFALLSQTQRQELVSFMKENEVYEVDYRGAKVVERAGKQGYEYAVRVNLPGYIATLKKVDEMMGLGQLESVDPRQYEGAEPAELRVVASINGRQLLEVSYAGTDRKESYSSYGAQVPVEIPETNLMRSELEQKVQSIFGPAT